VREGIQFRRMTGLTRLSLIGFVGLLTATVWKIVFLDGLVPPAIASGVVFAAIVVGLVVVRTRWMPAAAAAVAAFAVIGAAQSDVVRDTLANPSDVADFASSLLLLVSGVIAIVGAVGATMQRYRDRGAAG
jgi:hypothetical protein